MTDQPQPPAAPDEAPAAAPRPSGRGLDRTGPFEIGDKVQLADAKNRLHTITLKEGGEFHTHRGVLRHDQLIGAEDGVVVEDLHGTRYQALRPLYSDYMLAMPRGAAIIYPKDSAQILMWGDIFPGARVLEAGVGSGGLTTALLRAVGPEGTVHSIERREDFAEVARENVETYFGGPHPAWDLSVGDFQDLAPTLSPGEPAVDRVVLDMLAPWECVDAAAEVLVSGGVYLAYVATVTQLSRTAEALRAHGEFTEPYRLGELRAALAPRGSRRAPRAPDERPHRVPAHRPAHRARHAGADPGDPTGARLPSRGGAEPPRQRGLRRLRCRVGTAGRGRARCGPAQAEAGPAGHPPGPRSLIAR